MKVTAAKGFCGKKITMTMNGDSYAHPVSKWKKQQYIDWLKSKDIAVPKKNLRAELWTMCKQERDRYPAKIVESIAKNAGHETLRRIIANSIQSKWFGGSLKIMSQPKIRI